MLEAAWIWCLTVTTSAKPVLVQFTIEVPEEVYLGLISHPPTTSQSPTPMRYTPNHLRIGHYGTAAT